jgi:hypothetical protein
MRGNVFDGWHSSNDRPGNGGYVNSTENAASDRQSRAHNPLTAETRAALDRLKIGARCQTCSGRDLLVRAGVCLCATCGNIERLRAQADRMRTRRK